eukprot:2242130-Rhodomonas_salina.2
MCSLSKSAKHAVNTALRTAPNVRCGGSKDSSVAAWQGFAAAARTRVKCCCCDKAGDCYLR